MEQYDFCYWDAKSQQDLLIIIVNQTITSTIAITALLRLPTLFSLMHSQNIKITTILAIHILVLLWGICQSIVNFYSIIVWIFHLQLEQTPTQMIDYSHIFSIICSFPGFLVQTLFITICYTFSKNLLSGATVKQFPTSSFKFLKTMKIYYIIRILLRVAIICLISLSSRQNVGIYSMIEFISLIVDSAIINVFIIFSVKMFLGRLRHKSFDLLKKQYCMMFLCSLCRIIIDSLFLVLSPHTNENNLCVGPFADHLMQMQVYNRYSIFYNIIGNLLMHFLPIAIILKIYKYDHRDKNQELLMESKVISSDQEKNSQQSV